MKNRKARYTGRLSSTAGITVALGLLLWAVLAYAASTVQTYSDGTYTTVKTKFGRGIDSVYSRMAGGFNGATYYAEYWGPSTDEGTDLVYKPFRSPALTADGSGMCTDTLLSSETGGANSGMWQVRYHHNPQYALPLNVVIDSPAPGQIVQAGTAIPNSVMFHLEDRDGNIITGDNMANLRVLFKDGATTVHRDNKAIVAVTQNKGGWSLTSGYYKYVSSIKSGSLPYTPTTDGNMLLIKVSYLGGIEAGDTYDMGAIVCERYTQVNPTPVPDAYAYDIVPAAGMNENFVGNPTGSTTAYDFYFDMLDYAGNAIPSGSPSWAVRTAAEAMDYDVDLFQTTVTGSVYAPGVAPNTDPNHWLWRGTLNAPGKYLLKLRAGGATTPECDYVINFGATKQWEMAGDVTPPAEATGLGSVASDNSINLSWTNPGDPDFLGVLILQSFNSFTPYNANNEPVQGKIYTPTPPGNTTEGTSKVVYFSNGTSHADGAQCNGLINNTQYFYKVYTFDDKYNYSAGVEISNTPVDTVKPGEVTGVYVTEGDQENTIHWTNPADCDVAGGQVTIRYRTDGTFPSKRDGSDGSTPAGNKAPSGAGLADSFLHGSRTNGTPYFYTIWISDNDGNWSNDPGGGAPEAKSPASYAVPHDVTEPAPVSDLDIKPGSIQAFDVILQWTATGDDGSSGQATKYDIRYSNLPIVTDGIPGSDWDKAWHTVGENPPQPVPYGGVQEYKVAGLSPLTTYYFAMKVVDEAGNWSGKSTSSPTATTLCNEQLTACNQCHLLPPDDDLPGAHPRGSGNIGSHDLPIHASADYKQCNVCHADGDVFDEISGILHYEYNHQNDVIDINAPGKIGNKQERDSLTGGTFNQWTTTVFKYKNYSSGVGYTQITGRCENTYCHGAGLSSPRWGLDKIVCGEYCHETPPATGRHVKHYHPGQHYVNFAPAGTLVSGYDNDDGTVGWTGAVSTVNRGPLVFINATTTEGNNDQRYATYLETVNAQKEFILPDGTWYITVCVGDPNGPATGQTVKISGNSTNFVDGTWTTLVNNFSTTEGKLFKKAVDHEFIVTAGRNLKLKLGDNSIPTKLNFLIVNATPEAPKSNVTLLQNTASEYGFACGKCHVKDVAQARHTEHVAGAFQEDYRDAEIAFDGNSFPKNSFGLYTVLGFANISSKLDGQGFNYTTGHSCVNLYCHGATLDAGGSNHTPQWRDGYIDVTGADLCGACHDAGYADTTPLSNMSTGSHHKHASSAYAYEFDCYKCHNHTVGEKDPLNGNKIPVIDKTHHVNGDVDVVFDPNDNTMKFGRYSTPVQTCYEVYCHSNGLLTPAGEPASYTRYAEPVWGSPPKDCNYCHGTSTSDGMPDYFDTASTLNSHDKHVRENHQGCSKCHNDTTRDDGLTIYSSIHVDGKPDVTFSALNAGASYDAGSALCINTYCHGLTAAPQWGGTAKCGSCHGDGDTMPNPDVGAHYAHSQGNHGNISTINANASTQTNYDFDCRFCHFYRMHGGGKYDDVPPIKQAAEVNFNLIDVDNAYNNSAGVYIQGDTQYIDDQPGGSGWEYTNGRCYNVLCHSDGRGGMPNISTFTWTDAAGSLNCHGCHGGSSTAPVGMKIDSHNHPKHVWDGVYRKSCQDCHEPTATGSSTITDRSMHVNARADVGISVTWNGSYDETYKTCSNNDCHSNSNPSEWNGAGSAYFVMMNWTTSVATTCSTCHADNYYPAGDGTRASQQTLSHNHRKHVSSTANGGYATRYGCTNCHNKTALDNGTIKSTVPTSHNNQQTDIVYYTSFFNMTGPYSATPGSGSWGNFDDPSRGDCTVICHSKPSTIVGNNDPALITSPIRFPNWSTVNYGCGGCHGDKDSLTSGSHVAHAKNNNIDCGACHGGTAKADLPLFDGQAVISDSGYDTYHVDLTKQVSMAATVGGSWSGNVTQTCTTTSGSCHPSGFTSLQWGTAATCTDCHMDTGAAGSEVDDYTFGNGTSATINQIEYNTVGHGFSNVSTYMYSSNSGAQLDCTTNCHTNSVPHASSTNPFRLQNADTDLLCATCHATSQANHHTKTTTGGDAAWTWTPKCVDCHDPHGDYSDKTGRVNRYMIQGYVNHDGASDDYGVPAATISVGFPDNGGGAEPGSLDRESFVQSDFSGLCQVCHPAGGSAASHPDNFSRDLYDTGHSGTDSCTASCHPHPVGFQGGGNCNSCHSDQGAGADLTHSYTGKHLAHTDSAGYVLACELCHAWNNASGNVSHKTGDVSADQTAEVAFHDTTTVWTNTQYEGAGTNFKYIELDAAYGLTGISPTYQAWTTLTDLTDPVNGAREWTEGRCSAVWCHSNANPLGGTMTYASFANWSTAETANCAYCHGGPGATGTMSAKHGKHVDTYSITCSRCHKATVSSGNSPVSNKSVHVDGTKDVSFDARNPAAGYATPPNCTAMYCHGDGNGTSGSAAWNGAATTCTSCHKGLKSDAPNQMATGTHNSHINNTDANLASFTCDDCHSDTTSTGSTITGYAFHVNSSIDVNMGTGSFDGTKCSGTACHRNGAAVSPTDLQPTWGGAAIGCNGCHGTDNFYTDVNGSPDYENVTGVSPVRNGHYVGGHVSAATDCVKCHSDTVDAAGAIKASSLHLNGSRNVNLTAAGGGTWDGLTCSGTSSSCHQGIAPTWGGTLTCYDCHIDTGAIGTENDDYTYGSAPKATINELEWLNAGHGRTGTNYPYTDNAPANKTCEDCHTYSVAHNDPGGNYFRLTNADTNALCTGCHATSTTNHHNETVVDTYHVGPDAVWSFTPKCVDCHDPHGDNGGITTSEYNAAMIHSAVNTSGSDTYGVPIGTTAVDFPADWPGDVLLNWSSFVVNTSNNGICQVCHDSVDNVNYFNKTTYTWSHNTGTVCDTCHTHDKGFAGAGGSCTGCHGTGGSGVGGTNNRRNIETDFTMNSHHINATGGLWANVDPTSCAACHPEGNYADGSINATYHNDGTVNLKQWTGAFPASGNNGTFTALIYSNEASATNHCLSCHNETNKTAAPFSASGDSGTPNAYSWDTNSIDRRWSSTGTTPFSKYSPNTFNVVPQINKAYSPHRDTASNQRGVQTNAATNWADDAGGNPAIACLDCHNSHGSDALAGKTAVQAGVTYTSAVGRGAILKTTATYAPANGSGTGGAAGITWSATADLCWDCHLGDDASAPKDYNTGGPTYTAPIAGYYDGTGRWTNVDAADWTPTYSYKTALTDNSKGDGTQKGGHFGASSALTKTTPSNPIDGTCNKCHDPHGVYSAKTNAAYMVPALKGAWLHSPYKEDRAPAGQTSASPSGNTYETEWVTSGDGPVFKSARLNPDFAYNNPQGIGNGYGHGISGTTYGLGGTGGYGYFIDDNTFGTDLSGGGSNTLRHGWLNGSGSSATYVSGAIVAKTINETDTQFAGLCLNCHTQASLVAVSTTLTDTSVEAHKTVKGWGATGTSDLFKQADAHNHLMAWKTTTTSTNDMRCSKSDRTPYVLPSGYRWSVDPGPPTATTTGALPATPSATSGQALSGGVQQQFHSFPCSKCHTAHTSKLPRLMKTNCIDVGTSATAPKHADGGTGEGTYNYPLCVTDSPNVVNNKLYTMTCHNTRNSNTPGGGGWNEITGW